MPSRLSSLLVRDGLVGVKRMEKAFQRQVIYGGSLDTILLEMNFVPEERLTQYLALASGLPPAARDEGERAEATALALLPREISEQFRAVPLALQGEALRVLVCSPLEMSELEDLADLLDRPLQPLITPEYRWHLAYAKAYAVDAPARFETLARQVAADEGATPVGRARSVIVDDAKRVESPIPDLEMRNDYMRTLPLVPALPRLPATPAPPAPITDQPTMRVDMAPVVPLPPIVATPPPQPSQPLPVDLRGRTDTIQGVTSSPVIVDAPSENDGVPEPVAPRPLTPSNDTRHVAVAIRRSDSAPMATSGRDSPLGFVPARELLATADDRDTVFLTLLRAARARARYAALLTVQGGAAIGRVALAEPELDTDAIQRVLIPLDGRSPFRSVVEHQQPHVGPLATGDSAFDAMVMRLGGMIPPSALIMPIVLRERVVALVVAHRATTDLKVVDVTELLPLAAAAADALGRLIVKHKSAGYRAPAPDAAPKVVIEGALVDTKKTVRPGAEWRTPAPVERPSLPEIESDAELSITHEPPRPINEVLDEIETSKEGDADAAISDAIERATEALGELNKRFPGKLRVDRFTVAGRPLRAAQYGGLLELVVRLGSAASELLIEQMSSAQRDLRFYATICTAELRPRNAVYALVERLFDQDYGVRATAIEALAGYPMQDLSHALSRARRAVHGSDPEVVAAAASAIVRLGDVEAIGDLIGVIERGDRASDHVRKALVALTAQDFGGNERKWRKWWDASRRQHRIEWLIDGLSHKEDAIRESSILDLRRLTGEYFGYHHDLPKKEREAAAERWAAWWRDTGQRRFIQQEDERNRPTGVLPVQRGD
jgi:HEAT repeat protein